MVGLWHWRWRKEAQRWRGRKKARDGPPRFPLGVEFHEKLLTVTWLLDISIALGGTSGGQNQNPNPLLLQRHGSSKGPTNRTGPGHASYSEHAVRIHTVDMEGLIGNQKQVIQETLQSQVRFNPCMRAYLYTAVLLSWSFADFTQCGNYTSLETNVISGKFDWGSPSKHMLYTYSGVHKGVGCMQRSLTTTKSCAIHSLQRLGGKKAKEKEKNALHSYIHFTSRSYATKILLSRD